MSGGDAAPAAAAAAAGRAPSSRSSQQQQPPYTEPVAATKPPQQEQQQRTCSGWKPWLLGVAALLLVAALAAGVLAVLCSTQTLQCSLRPFSIRSKGSGAPAGSSSSKDGSPPASCPVEYAAGADGPPLLLGGASAACKSGCQPRDDTWGESCKMQPDSVTTWGLCEAGQRPALVALLDKLSGGGTSRFNPCDMWSLLRGRTLWLIGDSHMKSAYTAARCVLQDFWDHSQGECAAVGDAAGQLELHKSQLYAPRNLTLADITEPRCIHITGGGRLCFLHAVRGEVLVTGDAAAPGVLELVQQRGHAGPDDVFYVSFGRWYTHSCRHFEEQAYNRSLAALASHYRASRERFPNVVFGVPPFDHTTCDPSFDPKKAGAVCPAVANGTALKEMYYKIADGALDALEPAGLRVVDYQEATLPLTGAHLAAGRSFKSAIDCLHYCRPGLPELDVWFAYDSMKQRRLAPVASRDAQTNLPCTRVKPFM